MPNQAPIRMRMQKSNRLTRRQGEALVKALLTVDEKALFQEQELKSFRTGFDKLTKAWREALEKENKRPQAKSQRAEKVITSSALIPPKRKRVSPKITYIRRTNGS